MGISTYLGKILYGKAKALLNNSNKTLLLLLTRLWGYNVIMYFYEVFVSSQRYHGSGALTYGSDDGLARGQVVTVPLGKSTVPAIVSSEVEKPAFLTKHVSSATVAQLLPEELLQLHDWLRSYYPAPLGFITQLFLPSSLTVKPRVRKMSSVITQRVSTPPLTAEQEGVIATITDKTGSYLLHGDTGSGKTRVYIELAERVLAAGRSVSILTPEIGLTPQLIKSFEEIFPGAVRVIHSHQTTAERRNSWLDILAAEKPQIIIGPRSALFAPVKNVGLVVVDEAHDGAYKQEQMPYYQATRVAAKLADLHQASLILGTATPLVHDYYAFTAKNRPILRMTELASGGKHKTQVKIIDLKDRTHFTRSPWLSIDLLKAIENALHNNGQSLVFLNRRGTARLVLCKTCGWQAACPRCDLPLTFHGDHFHLRCHTCGYTEKPQSACPTCSSTDIQFKSIGTKTIMEEITRLFPGARIKRFDSDTTKSDRLEAHYEAIKAGEVDVLVGTQMLSKGLDLPRLKVVGVVLADTGLYFPDYTAEERTYQMLRQVIGRVGRGHQESEVIIQTYYPESPTIQSVVENDYTRFYQTQLQERELYRFPPFYFVLKVQVERATSASASKAVHDLAEQILKSGRSVEITGPSPSFIEKQHNKYRWQLIIKSKQRTELISIIQKLPKNCTYDIDPTNLL